MSVGTTITDGSLLLALPLRCAAGARVVPVAVRAAARARLPVLRHRADRRRPGRPRTAAGCSPARCCSSPASPSSSSARACFVGALRRLPDRAPATAPADPRQPSPSCSAWRSWARAVVPARRPGAPPPVARAGSARRCSACCSASAGRRASARRSPPCWRSASTRGSATRGGMLAVAYCLGLGLPFVLVALAFRRVMGAFGWVKRHYAVGDAPRRRDARRRSACCW